MMMDKVFIYAFQFLGDRFPREFGVDQLAGSNGNAGVKLFVAQHLNGFSGNVLRSGADENRLAINCAITFGPDWCGNHWNHGGHSSQYFQSGSAWSIHGGYKQAGFKISID